MDERATRLLNPEQKQINRENFVVIQGWMISDLHLKGASLIIYAIIYGFSQDSQSSFKGSAKYLSDWASVSIYTVYDILKKLCSQGLIKRIEKEINGIKIYDYQISREHPRWQKTTTGRQKTTTGRQKTTTPVIKDQHPPVVKDQLDNINIHNLVDNNIYIASDQNACEKEATKPKREKTALQEFSNQVIERFEKLEKHQIPIWFRRNCRCLTDILNFCGGKKENIPLALECINICCDLMEKRGFNGAGYEAVCRNLPYYYEEAKKKFRKSL